MRLKNQVFLQLAPLKSQFMSKCQKYMLHPLPIALFIHLDCSVGVANLPCRMV